MAWTTQDKVGLASTVGSALLGGLSSSKNAKANEKTSAAQQVIAALRNRQAALAEQQALQQRQAEQYANMNPLGAEQQYIQRQKALQAMLPTLGGKGIQSGDPAIAAAQGGPSPMFAALANNPGMKAALSDNAIQRAILDRRNATTVVDPTIQRMPLSDYGFMQNDPYQKENDDLRTAVLGRQQASRDAILADANTELSRAEQLEQQASQQKDSPWWKKVLGPAAGIASAFIPGVGPLLSMGIGAAVGGASDGARGAALGAAGGYGTEAILGKSFTPWSLPQSGAGQVASPDWSMRQGNLAESAGMLPGGLMPSEVVDQGFQGMMRGAPPALLQGRANPLTEAITGVAMDRPSYGQPRNNAPRQTVAPPPQTIPTVTDPNALGGPNAQIGSNSLYNRFMNTIRDYGEEIGMPGAVTPDGPDSPFGRAIQSPMGGLMTGAVGNAQRAGQLGQAASRVARAPRRVAPPAPPMGGATAGANPLAGFSAGNPAAVNPVVATPDQQAVAQAIMGMSRANQSGGGTAGAQAILDSIQGPLSRIPGRIVAGPGSPASQAATGQALSPEIQALIARLRGVLAGGK